MLTTFWVAHIAHLVTTCMVTHPKLSSLLTVCWCKIIKQSERLYICLSPISLIPCYAEVVATTCIAFCNCWWLFLVVLVMDERIPGSFYAGWRFVKWCKGGKPIFHNFIPFAPEQWSQCKFHQTSQLSLRSIWNILTHFESLLTKNECKDKKEYLKSG